MPPRASQHLRNLIAPAHKARHSKKNSEGTAWDTPESIPCPTPLAIYINSDMESECGYESGVGEKLPDISSDDDYYDTSAESEGELSDFDEAALVSLKHEIVSLAEDMTGETNKTMMCELQGEYRSHRHIPENIATAFDG